ncbi:MAG TPA: chemotaxis protein CheB [Holophaga sp.]|nr:chemotaxis protein CheB [Holophaga sp.]
MELAIGGSGRPGEGGAFKGFPVVGLGASAGGLEALDQFFRALPPSTGLAFVIIQHLDPTRPGVVPELLQRATPMPVSQAVDRVKLRPDHVYMIPPGKGLAISGGRLQLTEPPEARGLRLPIDAFFRSLAQACGDRAVGVVLSGMGSDGRAGLEAIRQAGGLCLVQAPESARFDSMPRSALQAVVPDRVGPPAHLAAELARGALLSDATRPQALAPPAEPDPSAFERVCRILRERTGHDFSLYKKSTIHRRMERRMGVHGLEGIGAYVRFLEEHASEADSLLREILIGVTGFFRDPEAWAELVQEVLPRILERHPEGGTVRAWVPGCSTGEDAFSLAIGFQEALAAVQPASPISFQIFATDLNRHAIAAARQGFFAGGAVGGLSPQRLETWFRPEGTGWRVTKAIREPVVFALQDLVQDPPFIRLDLIVCRNVMIYLSADLQKRLLPLFHYSLDPGGYLFLGNAESIGGFADLFAPHPGRARLFSRNPADRFPRTNTFPLGLSNRRDLHQEQPMPKAAINPQQIAEQALLQRFTPPAVLATEAGEILYISGRTGKYLEPAMGKASLNVFAMAREGLGRELPAAFRRALAQREPVEVKGLRVEADGSGQAVDLVLQTVPAPDGAQPAVLIVFKDAPAPHARARTAKSRPGEADPGRIEALEEEVRNLMAELQANREEMQTSQEELRASNEELQSTNEELQSTNEELTTSKEELQSLNEELQTVNAEQQAKVDELSAANNDMKNLLDATDIATLFLDDRLNVRRFTTGATRLFKLIPGDVGRPLSDLVTDLDYPALDQDAREVLRTLVPAQKDVADRAASHWYAARILPYRTLNNVIAGVVITFMDITRAKELEARLLAHAAEGVRHG